tara:strand:+ start:133 stop:240 length:108 start_codon:yes stop_codon:yes gene_type:complete
MARQKRIMLVNGCSKRASAITGVQSLRKETKGVVN